jgi:hypothetical protein
VVRKRQKHHNKHDKDLSKIQKMDGVWEPFGNAAAKAKIKHGYDSNLGTAGIEGFERSLMVRRGSRLTSNRLSFGTANFFSSSSTGTFMLNCAINLESIAIGSLMRANFKRVRQWGARRRALFAQAWDSTAAYSKEFCSAFIRSLLAGCVGGHSCRLTRLWFESKTTARTRAADEGVRSTRTF